MSASRLAEKQTELIVFFCLDRTTDYCMLRELGMRAD